MSRSSSTQEPDDASISFGRQFVAFARINPRQVPNQQVKAIAARFQQTYSVSPKTVYPPEWLDNASTRRLAQNQFQIFFGNLLTTLTSPPGSPRRIDRSSPTRRLQTHTAKAHPLTEVTPPTTAGSTSEFEQHRSTQESTPAIAGNGSGHTLAIEKTNAFTAAQQKAIADIVRCALENHRRGSNTPAPAS